MLAHFEADVLVLAKHGSMHCLSIPLTLLVLEHVKENF